VYECLIHLSQLHIVHYIPKKHSSRVTFLQNRVLKEKVVLSREIYEERKERYKRQLKSMLDYIQNEEMCKSRQLLRFFGEDFKQDCGECSSCLRKKA
jgi:ATP-dependent DNA helicase RecQ